MFFDGWLHPAFGRVRFNDQCRQGFDRQRTPAFSGLCLREKETELRPREQNGLCRSNSRPARESDRPTVRNQLRWRSQWRRQCSPSLGFRDPVRNADEVVDFDERERLSGNIAAYLRSWRAVPKNPRRTEHDQNQQQYQRFAVSFEQARIVTPQRRRAKLTGSDPLPPRMLPSRWLNMAKCC